jgi:hypothetical protein
MRRTGWVSVIIIAAVASATGWALTDASTLRTASKKVFAQKLVEEILRKHSEINSLEIAADSPSGCQTIAATDPKDLGEKCDNDEIQPLKTGEPFVEQEKDGFDVTLPLYDRSNQILAVVGIDFKVAPGQTKESIVKQGRQIAAEIESQVPSKDKLFEPQ